LFRFFVLFVAFVVHRSCSATNPSIREWPVRGRYSRNLRAAKVFIPVRFVFEQRQLQLLT